MRNLITVFIAFSLLSCEKSNKESNIFDNLPETGDAPVTDTVPSINNPKEGQPQASGVMDSSLLELDTLYNFLAKRNSITGMFLKSKLVTPHTIDASSTQKNHNLLSVFITTACDTTYYEEEINYDSIAGWILILDPEKGEPVFFKRLGKWANRIDGRMSSIDVSAINLKPAGDGIIVHNLSSEEGAGDYGFNRDDAEMFILKDGNLQKILEITLVDSWFSSDEESSWVEQKKTRVLSPLGTSSQGFWDLNSNTSLDLKGSDDQELKVDPEEAADDIYKWNGSKYEKVVKE